MKNSILKISLLALISIFALSACSMKCPFSSDEKACCSGEKKCDKEGCKEACGAKAEGKTCGGESAGAEKKSCCGK